MSLRGVEIKEGKIGANVGGDGREFALVCNGVAVTASLELNKPYSLRRVADVDALGIDAKYDADNNVRVFRHISEFYRTAGDGKTLNLLVLPQTVKPAEMVESAKAMVAESTMISDIAFAYNPVSDTPTYVDGLPDYIHSAIPELQEFAQWCDENDMPLHVILEGRNIADNIATLADLRNLQINGNILEAQKVTLVIGQDWNFAQTQNDVGKKYADVGTFLGCVAAQAWNRNPGEVETMMLTNTTRDIFTIGGLSNHKKYHEVFEQLETLDEKGYVFPIRYTGYSGYWWNDGHCCTPIIIDNEGNINQHSIYYSHTIDMSKRALRMTFLPEVKKPVELENGKLGRDMLEYYNGIGDMTFAAMENKSLISKGRTYTDPESDLLIEKQLNIQFAVNPTGMTGLIKGTINLKNQ